MKQMIDFSNFILDQYPQVKEEMIRSREDFDEPYTITSYLRYYYDDLILSEKLEDQEQAKDILRFINQVMNSNEYDDRTRNMVHLNFIGFLIEPHRLYKEDLYATFLHKKVRLAKEILTGEALNLLRFWVLIANENYCYRFPISLMKIMRL